MYVTPADLHAMANDGVEGVTLHRCSHLPDHDPENCWCAPLVLTNAQMRAPTIVLARVLAEHFAVH